MTDKDDQFYIRNDDLAVVHVGEHEGGETAWAACDAHAAETGHFVLVYLESYGLIDLIDDAQRVFDRLYVPEEERGED